MERLFTNIAHVAHGAAGRGGAAWPDCAVHVFGFRCRTSGPQARQPGRRGGAGEGVQGKGDLKGNLPKGYSACTDVWGAKLYILAGRLDAMPVSCRG